MDPPNQTANTVALHTVCLTLVTLCVAMRLYTRQFIIKQLGADDCKALSQRKACSSTLMVDRSLPVRLCTLIVKIICFSTGLTIWP